MKHHCRCCGNIICDSCSPNLVVIYELNDLVKVCIQCYWGQSLVCIEDCYNSSFLLEIETISNYYSQQKILENNFLLRIQPITNLLIEANRFFIECTNDNLSSTVCTTLR